MMNKYLTFLLVLLTATGTEAQTIKSALASSMGDFRFEESLTPEQMRAFGADIMSVLKVLQLKVDNNNSNNQYFFNHSACLLSYGKTGLLSDKHLWDNPKVSKLLFVESSVSIRAPSPHLESNA